MIKNKTTKPRKKKPRKSTHQKTIDDLIQTTQSLHGIVHNLLTTIHELKKNELVCMLGQMEKINKLHFMETQAQRQMIVDQAKALEILPN